MRSTIPMRVAKIGNLILYAALCVFGAMLIQDPEIASVFIIRVTGLAMVIFGVFKIVGYLSKDLFRLAFQYDLAVGSQLIVVGVLVSLWPEDLANFFCVLMGLTILADGLFKIQIALDARQFGIHAWGLILALAIFAGIFGGILLFRPTQSVRILTILLGIALLADGILGFITVLTSVKIVRWQKPDVIDVDYRETKD